MGAPKWMSQVFPYHLKGCQPGDRTKCDWLVSIYNLKYISNYTVQYKTTVRQNTIRGRTKERKELF